MAKNLKKSETCISCGKCLTVCPKKLSPLMFLKADYSSRERALKTYSIEECIGCYSCQKNCPTKAPLSESMRRLKSSTEEINHYKESELTKDNTGRVMLDVVISLIPVIIAAIYFWGWRVIPFILTSCLMAMTSEYVLGRVFKVHVNLKDGSAFLTGLLFALASSIMMPYYLLFLGSFFAIFLGKIVFGGIGRNIFNPALIGKAIVVTFFAKSVKVYQTPELIAGATILEEFHGNTIPIFDMVVGNKAGCIGEISIIAIVLGGVYLIYRKRIDYIIPVASLVTIALISFVLGRSPLDEIFSGGVFFGMFFMATDPVTMPYTRIGRLIFSIGVSIFIMIIRIFAIQPEGVAYAILIMNSLTPMINLCFPMEKLYQHSLKGGRLWS